MSLSSCPSCVVNGSIVATLRGGSCIECKAGILYSTYSYCRACAEKLKKYYQCGNDIKPSREYIADIKVGFDAKIKFTSKKWLNAAAKTKERLDELVKILDTDKPASETLKIAEEC